MANLSFFLRSLPLCLALAMSALHAQQTTTFSATPTTAAPQAGEAQCILAGRLNSEGRWAPAASGIQLLDASGQRLPQHAGGFAQPALAAVKAVRLAEPALLSKCNVGLAMVDSDVSSGSKSAAPAVAAGHAAIQVQDMATLAGRAGGKWVELRLNVPVERVVMITR